MNNKILIWSITILLHLAVISHAQYENIWVFGTDAGLNFNTGAGVPFKSNFKAYEAVASICDKNGELLFTTDGSTVYDRRDSVMPNGKGLHPQPIVISSTSQGALIIPFPRSTSLFYVFSLTAVEAKDSGGRLCYSVVDMSLNNGLGDVVSTQKSILLDTFLTEQMTSVSGDDCNVWLLVLNKMGYLKAYDITTGGISAVPQMSFLPGMVQPGQALTEVKATGCMEVSPGRNWLAIGRQCSRCVPRIGDLGLYRFDPSTGRADKEILLNMELPYYGVAFSADNTKLYTSVFAFEFSSGAGYSSRVTQHDLSSADSATIIGSEQVIYTTNQWQRYIDGLKRGPDNNIYIAHEYWDTLSVINEPDMPGQACRYEPFSLPLIRRTQSGMCFPNTVSLGNRGKDTFITSSLVNGCFNNPVPLFTKSKDGDQYLWSIGATDSSITVTEPGTYWVQYKIFCDTHIDTFHVDIFRPFIQKQNSCILMDNGKAHISFEVPTQMTYRIAWFNAKEEILSITDSVWNMEPGSYSVHIATAYGCDTIIYFDIGTEDPMVRFSITDTLVCIGDTLLLTNRSDPHFNQFNWSMGDGYTSGNFDLIYSYSAAGNYTVALAGAGEICKDTLRQGITVDQPMDGYRFVKDKEHLCVGEAVSFTPAPPDITLKTIAFDFGDDNSLTLPNAYDPIQHAYHQEGVKIVNLSAHFRACPTVQYADTVTVHPLPVVQFTSDSGICLRSTALILSNKAINSIPGLRYQWNTGDTTESITVKREGVYTLTLRTPYGCASAESIAVYKNCYADIPNAFTPNGDGINDYFFPQQLLSKGVQTFYMQILTRWGQALFETRSIDGRGWDGRFNNLMQPAGVYIYIIEIMTDNGKMEKYEGNITLLR